MENDKIYPIPDGFDTESFPNAAKYIMLHGSFSVMSKWDSTKPYKNTEEVYKECLKRETTWEKLLNFKGYDKNILL